MNKFAVGKNIKLLCKMKNMTLDQLAEEIGVSRDTMSRWCNGHRQITSYGLYRVSRALRVPMERLTEGIEDVDKLPSAQPKRGRWIEDKGQQTLMKNFIERGEVWRVCSVCGAGHMIGHKYASDKAYHDTHHNFCPNCGADMREG